MKNIKIPNELTITHFSRIFYELLHIKYDGGGFYDYVGLDDLDSIELLLQIEKELNISIDDDTWCAIEKDPRIIMYNTRMNNLSYLGI